MGKQLRARRSRSGLRRIVFFPWFVLIVAPTVVRAADAGATGSAFDSPGQEAPVVRTISADLLRYPLPAPARERLRKAQRAAQTGDHLAAIRQLNETLAKFPQSAAWIQPVLGIEYLKTGQRAAALKTLERAVTLLPRDAVNRSNFGLSLASVGEFDRAEQELRRSLELDRGNLATRQLLEMVETKRSLRNHD
jgi:Flp pilus assembly protein TadD